ncbi:cobyrinic acid a,c-diamide synthase [Methanothermococcus sp. SCGC AD-155-C09]|nr:cobyrinic acid a,c-diamide synthase [Methanothermococcus sp. SCGC AD-155-C09]
MEIGLLDIKGSLPAFERFGNLPTVLITEKNIDVIKDLDMLILPGGSLIESNSLNEKLKKQVIEFDGILLGICSGFQILSNKIDIGRKSPFPIFKEGLGLLDVEFSPLVCTDEVTFKLESNCIFGNAGIEGEGFHCHTYGNITINDKKINILTKSLVKKLNYKFLEIENYMISGVCYKNIYGTMVHGFLDNENMRKNLLCSLGVYEDKTILKDILEKNAKLNKKLKESSIININRLKGNNNNGLNNRLNNKNNKKIKEKKGIILLSTGSESGKTFLTTGIVSKLDRKTFVAKIGPDVRDIVPSLYILREPMLHYSSIKIGDRGWCDVGEFLKFVNESDYEYYIIEGVMGAFTGALNRKNYSGAEVSKLLGFPVYLVSSCNKSGIEGAFVESLGYYTLLKDIGIEVKGIILNRVYNFKVFEKIKKICGEIGLNIIGVEKINKANNRGLIPEVEIDYDSFCKSSMELNINIEIPKLDMDKINKYIINHNRDNYLEEDTKEFEDYLKKWAMKLSDNL